MQPVYLVSMLWPLLVAGLASTISVVAFPELAVLWGAFLLCAWFFSLVSMRRAVQALGESSMPPFARPLFCVRDGLRGEPV